MKNKIPESIKSHLPLNFCDLTLRIVVSFCIDSLAFFSNWVFAKFTNFISIFWEQHVTDCTGWQYLDEIPIKQWKKFLFVFLYLKMIYLCR